MTTICHSEKRFDNGLTTSVQVLDLLFLCMQCIHMIVSVENDKA